jgi:hypothetical protein
VKRHAGAGELTVATAIWTMISALRRRDLPGSLIAIRG